MYDEEDEPSNRIWFEKKQTNFNIDFIIKSMSLILFSTLIIIILEDKNIEAKKLCYLTKENVSIF